VVQDHELAKEVMAGGGGVGNRSAITTYFF
jgi:hypothetical protein